MTVKLRDALNRKKNTLLPPIDQDAQDELRGKLQKRQTADFYYLIDVVGACNLKCPSCPVGNYAEQPAKGFMSVAYLEKVLEKAGAEHPGKRLFFDLYNWGEPALHPELPQIIKAIKARNWGCGLSCNMNIFPEMKEVVKNNPDYIRISLSGYRNEIYQQTHRRGDINRVKSNMHMLRYYIDAYRSDVIVQVGFHVYRSNFPEDFLSMRRLCDELGFIFAPVIATLMPAEKAVQAVDGTAEPADRALLDNLVLSLKQWTQSLAPYRSAHPDCQYRSVRTTINFDGSVPLCCATFEQAQIIAQDFLAVPQVELQARKYAHDFCGTCMSRNLDMMYTAVPSPAMEARAADVLGPVWQAFVEGWSKPIATRIRWRDLALGVQEACDLATKLSSRGEKDAARQLWTMIRTQCPDHAEAAFQLGWLTVHEDLGAALDLFAEAERLFPGHPPYVAAPAQALAAHSTS
jgi:MoaA/NifB/PqqE/SkfB family radical SAM enzyme